MTIHQFELFADYFQLYLMDDSANDDTSEIWSDSALEAKLAVSSNTLAVGTFRNVDVNVEVEVLEKEPSIDLEGWDHASIGYIDLPTGRCAVFGCTDYLSDAKRIELPKGSYAALSLAKGLDSIETEWEEADDFYKVILWPSKVRELKILKRYENT
ncbi:hypothetical protein E4P82_02975 [Candidatus Competibacter phosphatis]|uniref:Uncharacterized protein n=1 Tax=Candidatus Competibacter phosphatis TaxID=221280 RepID=A0ABX1TFV4_9GAMM|nr:hypothetical protein [Candidatus Competibacter phosphatis]NMQ18248.1 hypothetical protein [Candidatus Competibacter phosphatis]